MMNNNLDWTQKVGDAMIAQQKDVADFHPAAARQGQLRPATSRRRRSRRPRRRPRAPARQAVLGAPSSSSRPTPTIHLRAVPTIRHWAYGPWPYPAYIRRSTSACRRPATARRVMTGANVPGCGVAAGAAMSLAAGHWAAWRGAGRLGRNSYTTVNVNRATHDQRQQLQPPTAIATAAGTTIRRIATACPIAPRPSASVTTRHGRAPSESEFRGQLDGTNRFAGRHQSAAATNREQADINREQANRNAPAARRRGRRQRLRRRRSRLGRSIATTTAAARRGAIAASTVAVAASSEKVVSAAEEVRR